VIAIVDDDPVVREATANLLRSLGLASTAFASAEDFLSQHGVVDCATCVISDMRLPGLSGIDLQTRLRAEGKATPVIFITAFPDEPLRRRALAGGAIGFLGKPYDAESLIDCLDKALPGVLA
jgi:FixJ family two-component response regulator